MFQCPIAIPRLFLECLPCSFSILPSNDIICSKHVYSLTYSITFFFYYLCICFVFLKFICKATFPLADSSSATIFWISSLLSLINTKLSANLKLFGRFTSGTSSKFSQFKSLGIPSRAASKGLGDSRYLLVLLSVYLEFVSFPILFNIGN